MSNDSAWRAQTDRHLFWTALIRPGHLMKRFCRKNPFLSIFNTAVFGGSTPTILFICPSDISHSVIVLWPSWPNDQVHSDWSTTEPLTYDLDLWTHPRYCQGQSLHLLGPHVKCFSQTANIQTDTWTHINRQDQFFIPSTTDAGGNNVP